MKLLRNVLLVAGIALVGLTGCSSKNDALEERNKRITKEYYNAPLWVFDPNYNNMLCAVENGIGKDIATRKSALKLGLELGIDPNEIQLYNVWRSPSLKYYVRMCYTDPRNSKDNAIKRSVRK